MHLSMVLKVGLTFSRINTRRVEVSVTIIASIESCFLHTEITSFTKIAVLS